MKISFSQNQLFDMVGFPLVSGRVSFFLHGSDTRANIYTLDGDRFVEAANPVILDDAGSFPQTVFMEAAIYDIRVEKLTDGTYSTIETYQYGFVVPDVVNDTVVEGIEGLMHANPELGFVTVVGYDGITYAGPRTYMWDSRCTEAEDGGCIIGSETTENGRWLLLSDLRELPCTYYGVEAGRESNMAAFLTYQPVVGTYGIFMPPVPRFLTGTYSTSGTMSSTKTISFDPGAKFTNLKFVCNAVEISGNTDYVADFQLVRQSYAESSWFRTARGFWQCGAAELHQSRTNFFASVDMGVSGLGIAHQKISGRPFAMTGVGYLLITDCDIAPKSLSTDWFIIFQNMVISDRWFADANWDIGYYAQGHHLQANTANGCVYSPDNFDNINVMVLALAYQGVTTLDLGGKTMGTISADMPFTAVLNGSVQEAHFSKATALDHVRIYALHAEAAGKMISATNSVLVISTTTAGQFIFDHCTVTFNASVDTLATAITAARSNITMNAAWMYSNPANHLNSQSINLLDTIFNNGEIQGTNIIARRCDFNNTVVRNVPGGIPGNYTLSTRIENCNFGGSAYLALTPGVDNSHAADVFEVAVGYIKITGNAFLTSAQYGIQMPFWAQDMVHRFIGGTTTFVPGSDPTDDRDTDRFPLPYIYGDNYGNCPRAFGLPYGGDNSAGALVLATGWASSGSSRSAMYFEKGVNAGSVFALPAVVNSTQDPLPDPVLNTGDVYSVSNLSVTVPYRSKALFTTNQNGGMCADFPLSGYMPVCAFDKSYPNDMFNCIVGSWGESAQFFGVNPIAPGQ